MRMSNRFTLLAIALMGVFFCLQVVAWYDNEYGYSQRVLDMAEIMARTAQ